MLEVFRKFSDTLIAKILLSVLALSFVSWGIAGYVFGGGANSTVLVVGKTDVSAGVLQEELRRQKVQLQSIMGKNIHMNPMMEQALLEQVIQNLTFRLLVDESAADLGLVLTDQQAIQLITQQKEFQDKDGKFSPALFHKILSYNGISEVLFMDEIKKQQTRVLLRESIVNGLSVPVSLAKGSYAFTNQQRVIQYKELSATDMKISKKPEDAELLSIYEQNKHLFIRPEFREVSYVYVLPKHLKNVEGDKQAALMQLAEKIENDIIGGAAMSDVAKDHGVQSGKLPSLTVQMQTAAGKAYSDNVISKEIFVKAFESDEGIETEMMPYKEGYIILKPESVKESAPLAYDEVSAQIKKLWLEAEQNKESYLKANELLQTAKEKNVLSGASTATVSRTDLKTYSPALISKSFSSKAGDWFLVKTDKGYAVGKVASIKNQTGSKEDLKAFQKNLAKPLSEFVFQDYVSYLKRTYGVDRNQGRINQFFIQDK